MKLTGKTKCDKGSEQKKQSILMEPENGAVNQFVLRSKKHQFLINEVTEICTKQVFSQL